MTVARDLESGTLVDRGVIVASCLGTAVAAWLEPASVQIANWSASGPVRIAIFAPFSRLWLPIVLALVASAAICFAGRGARAESAARARAVAPLSLLWLWTLPYWPWLPDRAPSLLALGGPARWLVAGAAVGGVLWSWVRAFAEQLGEWAQLSRLSLFLLTLVVYVVLGLRSLSTIGVSGDEPHYLVITHSLLTDHDLKIENNHLNRDYRAFFAGELRPDYLRRGQNGEIYSIHSPGLPVLLLPGYALAGAPGAVLTMCLFGALAALAVFDVALLVGGGSAPFLTWLSVCLTVPFVPHTWMLYPETVGAAIAAWSVWWLAAPLPSRSRAWVWRGVWLATLPWLHTKFVVLLAILVIFLAARLRGRVKDMSALAVPLAASSMAWLGFFYVVYGSIDPQVPYGSYTDQFVRFENIPRSLLGFLIDQKFGLLIYSPVYLAAVVGIWLLLRERTWRSLAVALIATGVPYVISSTRLYMWWGGSSAPARFLVPVLPLVAPAMCAAFARSQSRVFRSTMALCLALSILIAVLGVTMPERAFLFSAPHGVARLLEVIQGSAPVAGALPTFTEEDWRSPVTRAVPWVIAAMVALGVAWIVASRARRLSAFWLAALEATTFVIAGSVLAPISAPVRADSVMRGRTGLMNAYDPERMVAYDYGAKSALDASVLLHTTALTILRAADEPPDPQGRVTRPLELPPGRYEAHIWFGSTPPQAGNLLVSGQRGHVLARAEGPLANPASISFEMPARVPLTVSLSEQSSARAVRRVEILPISIVPKSRRVAPEARAVEAIDGHPNAYIVYTDDNTYPEGGIFWTRAASRGEVLVAPGGSATIIFTLHVGPIEGPVRINMAGRVLDTDMRPNETKEVTAAVPADMPLVPITIQAPAWFQPARVDSNSSDTRALGCQVRITLR